MSPDAGLPMSSTADRLMPTAVCGSGLPAHHLRNSFSVAMIRQQDGSSWRGQQTWPQSPSAISRLPLQSRRLVSAVMPGASMMFSPHLRQVEQRAYQKYCCR